MAVRRERNNLSDPMHGESQRSWLKANIKRTCREIINKDGGVDEEVGGAEHTHWVIKQRGSIEDSVRPFNPFLGADERDQ